LNQRTASLGPGQAQPLLILVGSVAAKGSDPDVVIAALLLDALETRASQRKRLPVSSVSISPTSSWKSTTTSRAQASASRERREAKLIKLADKTSMRAKQPDT
jgi:hypothetical protein